MEFMRRINGFIWGIPTLVLILLVGIRMTFVSSFAQFALFPDALRNFWSAFRKPKESGGVSSFQAFCTALGATVGTGNLAGVAGALALGGPGSIFWMWICGFLGMATKYAEAALGNAFRITKKNGETVGGTMCMLQRCFPRKGRMLGCFYCFFGIVASFGVGNTTQVNTVAAGVSSVAQMFDLNFETVFRPIFGILVSLFVFFLLSGGMKRIAGIVEYLVPVAASAYIFICILVLLFRWKALPGAIYSIVNGAFHPGAVTGGVLGSVFLTIRVGISRGVFTNEAGMGTASLAHGEARANHPAEQGMMGIMEVFLDTIVICSLTALVILVSKVPVPYGQDTGMLLTLDAFSSVLGKWSTVFLTVEVCLFAFATILGWGFYGAKCVQYIFGWNNWKFYAAIQAVVSFLGVTLSTGSVWIFAELFNGLMAIPNILALLMLSHELSEITKDYKKRKMAGIPACGGKYENLNQCKSMRTFPYEKISSDGSCCGKER